MASPPRMLRRNIALKTDFSLAELEGGLVCVEELNRSSDGTDGLRLIHILKTTPILGAALHHHS